MVFGRTCGLNVAKVAVSPIGQYFRWYAADVALWQQYGYISAPLLPVRALWRAVTLWVYLIAKSISPYLGLRLGPQGMVSMKEKHVLRCEALLGWWKNTLGPVSVPHALIAVMVGGIVRCATPYLSDTAEEVVRLNAAIKIAALQFENLPNDLSNVVVRFGTGLKLADIRVLCPDSVVVAVAQLTHHRSAVIKGELRTLLDELQTQYAVHVQFSGSVRGVYIALGRHVGRPRAQLDGNARCRSSHAILSVLVCARTSTASAMAEQQWATRSYTFKRRDVCVLFGPRMEAPVRSATDPANGLLHTWPACHEPGHWAVYLLECHEDHLQLPDTGFGPTMLDHVWLTGLQAVF